MHFEGAVKRTRTLAATVIRTHRWLPAVVSLISLLGLAVAVFGSISSRWIVASAASVLVGAYVWGYSAHVFKQTVWAPLDHFHRRQYSEVWDSLAAAPQKPLVAISDVGEEEELGPSTKQALRNLHELLLQMMRFLRSDAELVESAVC
jgi:hypothetical protein